jgi:hypothetical protein
MAGRSLGLARRVEVPTVLRAEGARFYFWSREPNEPPHIHVDRGGASAKVWLEPVALASNAGYPARELGAILRLVRERQPELLEAWHGFFGTG